MRPLSHKNINICSPTTKVNKAPSSTHQVTVYFPPASQTVPAEGEVMRGAQTSLFTRFTGIADTMAHKNAKTTITSCIFFSLGDFLKEVRSRLQVVNRKSESSSVRECVEGRR